MVKPTLCGLRWSTVVAVTFFVFAIRTQAGEEDIVINEIMYHPPFDLEDLQYIELYNRGTTEVDLSKWSFTKGVHFVFPDKTRVPAGEYLVVCRNPKVFSANYGSDISALGNFTNHLSHSGEKVELSNARGTVIDAVKYSDHEPWPSAPDGHSASLERISPFEPGKDSGNWAGSPLGAMQKLGGSPGRRNDSFSTNVPPAISHVDFKTPGPLQKAQVTVEVADVKSVKNVRLLWRIARSGGETSETAVPMQRISGDDKRGTYQAAIEGQPADTLVRFRIEATNAAGASRFLPSPNEPVPSYSYATTVNTNKANIAFAYVMDVTEPRREGRVNSRVAGRVRIWNRKDYMVPAAPTRGNGAFIYVPPQNGQPLVFDYVRIRPRKGGFKVHFNKGQPFKGMTGINVIFEASPRWLIAEPMAYELYRLAGNPALLEEHVRVFKDGQAQGYHLLIEQVNKGFLARNNRNDTGYLYKANWAGHGLTGQHYKKTRPATGYEDLIWLYERLVNTSGAEQWEFIQKNFNVEVWATYYAVNMCIENWDGFFNNYWMYHDTAGTGKWEIYPWDEDKTWGDYDGASPDYDWYTMPLTYGMGDSRGARPDGGFGWGGGGWWRPPGWFSGPLLANPQFRKVFLTRLKEICTTVFTEEKMLPLIDAMEKRLEPEVQLGGRRMGWGPPGGLQRLHSDMQSLRNQVKNRRQFILQQIPKDAAMR